MSAAAFSDLVAAIYDCALDPSLWPGVLEALGGEMRFRSATLSLQEMPSGRALVAVNCGRPAEEQAEMARYGPDIPEAWGGTEIMMATPLDESQVMTWLNPRAH